MVSMFDTCTDSECTCVIIHSIVSSAMLNKSCSAVVQERLQCHPGKIGGHVFWCSSSVTECFRSVTDCLQPTGDTKKPGWHSVSLSLLFIHACGNYRSCIMVR